MTREQALIALRQGKTIRAFNGWVKIIVSSPFDIHIIQGLNELYSYSVID